MNYNKEQHNKFDQTYWDLRWQKQETRWDIGDASPPITRYMDSITNKNAQILIPGCGNAYEAEYLITKGFKNITLIDISPKAVLNLQQKFESKAEISIICDDFFNHKNKYDIILEQTFFCALSPILRNEYVVQMHNLLKPKGILVGVLFNKYFNDEQPPFGGSMAEYDQLFKNYFHIKKLEPCYNSIVPRAGSEVFIELIKNDLL